MSTNNAVNNSLSGQTGTGSFAGSTSPTFVTPALGTPSSGTLTNCTGFPSGSLSGLGTGVATFLGTPSSANLASALTDELGIGSSIFGSTSSFTPRIAFGGASTGINYSEQLGEYLVIGNICFIVGKLILTNKGSATGRVSIEDLPFAASGVVNNGGNVLTSIHPENITISNNNLIFSINSGGVGSQAMRLIYYASGSGSSEYQDTAFTNTSSLSFSGFYFTA